MANIFNEDNKDELGDYEQEDILNLREELGGSSISREKMVRNSTLDSSIGKRGSSTFSSGTTDISSTELELPTSFGRVGTYPEETPSNYSDGHKKLRTERVENTAEEESKNYSDGHKKPRVALDSRSTSSIAAPSSISSEFFAETELGEPLSRTSSAEFSSLTKENSGKRKR